MTTHQIKRDTTLVIPSHAKINLFLEVLGLRGDGYHELRMINCDLALHDEVAIKLRPRGVVLDCVHEGVPSGEDNLAWCAARALLDHTGQKSGVAIRITKRIPVAAGLGGGSSNAAAVLLGMDRLLGLDLGWETLRDIGVSLGADLPYFLFGGPALVRGIGEIVETFSIAPELPVVLVNPGFPVATKEVYEAFEVPDAPAEAAAPPPPGPLTSPRQIVDCLRNDLEGVVSARHGEIEAMKSFLLRHGALGVLMSGSGPTVFGIFDPEAETASIAGKCTQEKWRVIPTRLKTRKTSVRGTCFFLQNP